MKHTHRRLTGPPSHNNPVPNLCSNAHKFRSPIDPSGQTLGIDTSNTSSASRLTVSKPSGGPRVVSTCAKNCWSLRLYESSLDDHLENPKAYNYMCACVYIYICCHVSSHPLHGILPNLPHLKPKTHAKPNPKPSTLNPTWRFMGTDNHSYKSTYYVLRGLRGLISRVIIRVLCSTYHEPPCIL